MFRTDLLKDERILVTGGGTGLGREMASRFAELGAEVIICGRRKAVLEETANQLLQTHGTTVRAYPCDIRSADSVHELVDHIWQTWGPLTGLVNNAAGNFISRTEDLSLNGFNAITDIVLRGTFSITHAVAKRWIDSKSRGSILSIIATFTRTGAPFVVPSTMAKAGVEAMTKSLAIEWGRYGIRLNAIAPGIFPTEGASARLRPGDNPHAYETSINPMRRLGRMKELQNLAVFLMTSENEWLSGETIAIDGAHHLANGAYFTNYLDWSDEQWVATRDRIRAQDAADKKAARS